MKTQIKKYVTGVPPPHFSSCSPSRSSILVLSNLAGDDTATARYAAALGAPLQLPLAMFHLKEPFPKPESELERMTATTPTPRDEAQTGAAPRTQAHYLPGSPQLRKTAGNTSEGVAEIVRREQPLLLAMDLNREHGLMHRLLLSHVLPVLRATHQPLLLVPDGSACMRSPRRVLVAVDDEPFIPNAASRALAPLLAAWTATFTVAHVCARPEQMGQAPGRLALADLRASTLLPDSAPLTLCEVANSDSASGLLRAVADTRADLLVLISRPRSFWGDFFHRGVTAAVLRYCPVPVLLLPAGLRG